MQLLKNIQFTRLIKIDHHLKEFNFRKSNGSIDSLFTIDTIDERHNRITFNMRLTGTEWKIIQNDLPLWIMENEHCLNEAIHKELDTMDIYVPVPAHNAHWQLNRLLSVFGFN
jgi:hypothetical protein